VMAAAGPISGVLGSYGPRGGSVRFCAPPTLACISSTLDRGAQSRCCGWRVVGFSLGHVPRSALAVPANCYATF